MNLISIWVIVFCCLFMPSSLSAETKAPDIEVVSTQLQRPWAMAQIAPEKILVTQITGELQLFDAETKSLTEIQGVPNVKVGGQGGLLDVAVPPEYRAGDWVYFTYSAPVGDNAATALGRARLDLKANSLIDWQTLIVTDSVTSTGRHFGSRIAFDAEHVFFSVGDRGVRENAQNLQNHAGSILRLKRDGSVPKGNPFVGRKDVLPEIWSYGHRNPQGLAVDNQGRLWAIEHGPRGGDEINHIQPGLNYGWPDVSHGKEYWNPMPVGVTEKKGMEPAKKVYVPSIAPSSLIVVKSNAYGWQGNMLAGALKLQHLNHLQIEDDELVNERRYFESKGQRIRALLEDADGILWVATDSGELWRLIADSQVGKD